jgi:NADH:ubiquinone oxidoreductase subunit 4 (subunit M)
LNRNLPNNFLFKLRFSFEKLVRPLLSKFGFDLTSFRSYLESSSFLIHIFCFLGFIAFLHGTTPSMINIRIWLGIDTGNTLYEMVVYRMHLYMDQNPNQVEHSWWEYGTTTALWEQLHKLYVLFNVIPPPPSMEYNPNFWYQFRITVWYPILMSILSVFGPDFFLSFYFLFGFHIFASHPDWYQVHGWSRALGYAIVDISYSVRFLITFKVFLGSSMLLPFFLIWTSYYKSNRLGRFFLFLFSASQTIVSAFVLGLHFLPVDWRLPITFELAGTWLSSPVLKLEFCRWGLGILLCFFSNLICFLVITYYLPARKGLHQRNSFLYLVFLLQCLLSILFTVNNVFLFYLIFEILVFPLSLIIGCWGSSLRRQHAVVKLYGYAAASSLPVFILFGLLYPALGSYSSLHLASYTFSAPEPVLYPLALLFSLPLLVKMPFFPFHLWLVEAHVEAITGGSVILAAIMLKVGIYGLYQFVFTFFVDVLEPVFGLFFPPVCFIGVIWSSILLFQQQDLKRFVAYSSVLHMNQLGLVMFFSPHQVFYTAFLLSISHGLTSAALFFIVGSIYDRYGTRNIFELGGLFRSQPDLAFVLCLALLADAGIPVSLSFVSELIMGVSLSLESKWFMFISFSATFLISTIAAFWLINRVVWGPEPPQTPLPRFMFPLDPSELFVILSLLCSNCVLGLATYPLVYYLLPIPIA